MGLQVPFAPYLLLVFFFLFFSSSSSSFLSDLYLINYLVERPRPIKLKKQNKTKQYFRFPKEATPRLINLITKLRLL